MTPEQNLIATLKEAIAEVREHNSEYQHVTPDATIEKWLDILATCQKCHGQGNIYHEGWSKNGAPVCSPCNGTGKRPLREVI